jgi:predicted AlkP superfamily phosphohydrolase/phosphomutase
VKTAVPPHRFLVIGLDGGTFDLLDPLMESGELPFLRSLTRRGVSAPLMSVYPSKTIPAWYSLATGIDPGGLGIFGFTEPDGGPGKSRLVQTFRPAEAIWDRLSRQGYRVGVVNFPIRAGYPIHGFLVPGMFESVPRTYPVALRSEIESALGSRLIPELPAYRESDRSSWMQLANDGVAQRAAATEFLIDRHRPDFLFVLFRETDRIEHQHWDECARGTAGMSPDLRAFWQNVDRACARLDRAFRALGEPAVTLVISDHGHGSARASFFTNRWLLQEGFLQFRSGAEPMRRRLASRFLLASDRFLPAQRMLRRLADRLRPPSGGPGVGRFLTGDATFEALAARIDWVNSVAYSYPVPEGIYLNPYRADFTPERKREIVNDLWTRLEAYSDARIEVLEPKSLYQRVRGSNGPALLLRVNDMEAEIRMDFSYPDPLLPHRPEYFYGTGVHRMDGILIAAGNGSAHGVRAGEFSLLDVAPTVLDGMGLPTLPAMSGRSFGSWLGTTAA